MTALAIIALALVLLLGGLAYWADLNAIREDDQFQSAQSIFDRIEADAKARGCTQDIHAYRKARQAFTHAALRGNR